MACNFNILVQSHHSCQPCFQLQQAAAFSRKALHKTHCAPPAQQQTADRQREQANEHSGAFGSQKILLRN